MNVAAIVLDLDDTLLDTSGLLVPVADRRALHAMRAAGLELDVEPALEQLAALRRRGVPDAFEELARTNDCDAACGRAGSDAFFRFEVPPLELDAAVAATLDALVQRAPLVLLTAGDERTQRAKIAALGIADRFEQVGVVAPGAKAAALSALLDAHGWPPRDVVVVGDRATSEIWAGNRLGCRTVLVRRPGTEHGDHEPAPGDRPWRTIGSVTELPALLG